jgi:serine/threonine protein kinase
VTEAKFEELQENILTLQEDLEDLASSIARLKRRGRPSDDKEREANALREKIAKVRRDPSTRDIHKAMTSLIHLFPEMARQHRDLHPLAGTAAEHLPCLRFPDDYENIEVLGDSEVEITGRHRLFLAVARDLGVSDDELQHRCVLKAFSAESKDSIRSFRRAVDALARLEHPHIVQIQGIAQEQRTIIKNGEAMIVTDYFIHMRYYSSGNLRRIISETDFSTPLSERRTRALQLMLGILSGLRILHGAKIVHRDLKPENIFLDEEGSPVIGDFETSKVEQKNPSLLAATTTRVSKTMGYVAPEVNAGGAHTEAADLFATGIIFAEILTGERVQSAAELKPTTLTPDLVKLLRQLLHVNPRKRGSARKLMLEAPFPSLRPRIRTCQVLYYTKL